MKLGKLIGYNLTTKNMDDNSLFTKVPIKVFMNTIDDADYEDISSVENWHKYGKFGEPRVDYLCIREGIRESSGIDESPSNWNNLTIAEKDIVIDYFLYSDDTAKVIHLMTTRALSQSQAVQYLQDTFGTHHILDCQVCARRASHPRLYSIVAKYLDLNDAKYFFQTVRNLYLDYKEQAIKGTLDGDVGAGLFDYIESTEGTIYETAGLSAKGYIMKNGDPDETNFIVELMDLFRKGIFI